MDLLGSPFTIYTDHRTLRHFTRQHDLSQWQVHWQETLSQYDYSIEYIKGEDNTVTDALSRLPILTPITVATTKTITTDETLLQQIRDGYQTDKFALKLLQCVDPSVSMRPAKGLPIKIDMDLNDPSLGICLINGLLFLGDRLVIPKVGGVCKCLFHLAHNTMGHFGAEKSYEHLRSSYY